MVKKKVHLYFDEVLLKLVDDSVIWHNNHSSGFKHNRSTLVSSCVESTLKDQKRLKAKRSAQIDLEINRLKKEKRDILEELT